MHDNRQPAEIDKKRCVCMIRVVAVLVSIFSAVVMIFQVGVCFGCDWLERCEPYRESVEAMLESEGVSKDYYYLMVAESRCTINAESNAGAQGFWQLMPRTSRKYGCNHPHDLNCATRAAIAYIKRLESEFKTFRDVIYAYNMGGHNYRRAKKPSGEAADLFVKVQRLKALNKDKE